MKFAQLNRQFVWSYVLVSWIPQLQISAVNFKLLLFQKKKEDKCQIQPRHSWLTLKPSNYHSLTVSNRSKSISNYRISPWSASSLIPSKDAPYRPLIWTINSRSIWKRLITNTIKLTSQPQVTSTIRASTTSTITPLWDNWSYQTLSSLKSTRMTVTSRK